MQVNSITPSYYLMGAKQKCSPKNVLNSVNANTDTDIYNKKTNDYSPYLKSYVLPFKGACTNLKKLQAYSPDGTGYVLKKNNDGSYLVDGETITKVYYGKDAAKFLSKTTEFPHETQVISPHDGKLVVETDGNRIPLESNGAVLIKKGAKAKITDIDGNLLVITSERKPVWYDEYGCTDDANYGDKFRELANVNFHLYDGHLRRCDLGEEIAEKLVSADVAEVTGENHIRMKHYYSPKFQRKELADILDDDEMAVFIHQYERALKVRNKTLVARRALADGLDDDLKEKLKQTHLISDLSKSGKNLISWRRLFGNEYELKITLQNLGFTKDEQEDTLAFWKRTNKLGFDYTGLKYLSEDVAVYELNEKLNNWTGAKTEWDSHSNSATSTAENSKSPWVGVSEVFARREYDHAVPFKKIRNIEVLHSHPSQIDKRQTEIYMITEGAGAITVIEGDKPKPIILKEGEGIVIQPGVKHCMSAAKGKYEHLCCQIPSTFQYGFDFKIPQSFPDGYSEQKASEDAVEKLEKVSC